ncbi:MAG: HAD family hydrolase [Candidatus Bathyarchaeia archaeon]
MADFKGIIFDLDGTLVHSQVNFRKMKTKMIEALEDNGVPANRLFPTMTTVMILRKAEELWEEQNIPEETRQKLRNKMEEYMNEGELEALKTIKPVPGVREAIARLHDMGYKMGILTRGHHEYAMRALEKAGIAPYFEVVLGRGETPKPKPYPEALKFVAQTLNLRVDEVLFVGDHHIDSTCAFNANCSFIGVKTGNRGSESWVEREPHVLIESVAELPEYLERNMDQPVTHFGTKG